MSSEDQPSTAGDSLKGFLSLVRGFISAPKEPTLFSLGGRGHFENPASDLLRFFLTPTAEHGFGSLFLRTFLECMGMDARALKPDNVMVDREVGTREGNRIDLLIKGTGWALLIENKIGHAANNPFDDYEAYARLLPGSMQLHFAMLAPSEQSDAPQNWKRVSYRRYCAALRAAFAQAVFEFPYSKWVVFAREFILHLENELYHPTMTPEQIRFVEEHLPEAEQVRKMLSSYNEVLSTEFATRLNEAVPGHGFWAKDEGWAWYCYDSTQARWAFTLQTPAGSLNSSRKFLARAYLKGLTPEQGQKAYQLLSPTMQYNPPSYGWEYWDAPHGFDSRGEAIGELCDVAKQLAELWQI